MVLLRLTLAGLLLLALPLSSGASPPGGIAPANPIHNRHVMFASTAQDAQRDDDVRGGWGGQHISLELTTEGGTVELDCAHGTLSRAIVPDAGGRFDVPGTYVEERGGPSREGEAGGAIAVRYAGRISAGKMRLTISRRDTKGNLGTFVLTRGGEPFIVKCR